jgi:hypothetical protein
MDTHSEPKFKPEMRLHGQPYHFMLVQLRRAAGEGKERGRMEYLENLDRTPPNSGVDPG